MVEGFPTAHRPQGWTRVSAVAIGLVIIALAVRCTLTSLAWIGQIFPGFLVLNGPLVAAVSLPGWSGGTVPDLYLSEIVAVDGEAVARPADVYSVVQRRSPQDPVRYRLRRDGTEREVAIATQRFTASDWFLLFGVYLVNGCVFAVAAFLPWTLRPSAPLTQAFLAFAGISALYILTAMDMYGPGNFYHLYLLANALVPAAALDLSLLFPEPHSVARWRRAGYPVAVLVFVLYEAFLDDAEISARIFLANTIYLGVVGGFFGARQFFYWGDRSQLVRQRVRVVAVGTLLGITLPGLILVTASVLRTTVAMNSLLYAFFVFPLSLAYAIAKHDLFEIESMVKRGATYLLVSGAVGASYVGSVLVFNLLLRARALTDSPAFPIVFTFTVILVFNPLRTRVQAFVDRVFFRTRYDATQALASVGAELAATLRRDDIVRLVRAAIDEAIPNQGVRLLLEEPVTGSIEDAASGERIDNELAEALATGRTLTAFDPPELYSSLARCTSVRAALASLGVEVAVPMQCRGELVGMIGVGAKRSGLFYTAGDAEFLRALAQEAAITLQNAVSYEALMKLNEELEARVRERTAELEASNATVSRAYAELKQAEAQLVRSETLASLGRLAAGVAHEINNPVSFIASNIEPLRQRLQRLDAVLPAEASEPLRQAKSFVEIMGRGAERTCRIVKDLASFSRLNQPARQEIDLIEGIEVTLRLLEPRWKGRIEIHRDYMELPALLCDGGQVNQVFMNLLSNACDAIERNGNIWISATGDTDYLSITIRDDGCGIEPAMLGRIFDPFYTTKVVGSGTGLGLAIVHGIVTSHGGHVEVESTPGKGTVFHVHLPQREEAAA
jgi:signal transduction histidine kinase